MNKPPAFQFYADDFLSGTADMTAEEVGAYIRLLCHAWSKDGLDDNDRLSLLAGQCQASALAHAKTKFRLVDGKLRNDRQELERQKQAEYRSRQADNGKKRWLGNANPHANPHADVKPPSPSPSPIAAQTNRGDFPTLEDVKAFGGMRGLKPDDCEQFWHHFESSGWIDKNGHPVAKWQSKLMTWKANSQAVVGATRTGAASAHKPFVSELKTVLEAKKTQRQRIYNRGHENALGFTARDQSDADDLKVLNREIAQLIDQIGATKL